MVITEIDEDLIGKWKETIYDRAYEVDPDNEQDWESIAIGFFLAQGLSIDEVHEIIEILIERGII